MPLRGAKTRWVFMGAPAGSENPAGFHPIAMLIVKPIPILAEESAGFHPCFNPIPNSGRNSSGMAVRAPPYGGCASPSGAQCRRKGVL
ncbi:MAG: hypothetical protein LBK61_06175 [Spirochaetaceae bacterium]|nr:hypothetical protein [Spirochaetaceae bacterium]